MRRWTIICCMILAVAAASLTACGQKGPLYLPDKPPQRQAQ